MSRKTQIQSFDMLQETASAKRDKVLEAIKKNNGATLFQLVKLLGWPINRISGRVTELWKDGLIYEGGLLQNPESGRFGTIWKATDLTSGVS